MSSQICYNRRSRYHLSAVILILVTIVVTTSITGFKDPLQRIQNCAIGHAAISTSANACKLNCTLLIVNGQVRTLVHLWKALLLNIVLPNEPCDIIFSIDGKREDIPDVVLAGLGTRIIAILTTENETVEGLKEFWLMKRAIQKMHADRYRFIIKTRTDLYHGIPISLKTVFGETDDFIYTLHNFHQILMNKTGRINFSVEEVLYAWMMTAGMVEFIPTMLIAEPYSPWSKLYQHEWNKNLKSTLSKCSRMGKLPMISENHKNNEKILRCFGMVLQRHKVVYNIGSTWVQFGHSQHMIPSAIKIADEFGKHTWADVGYNDSDTLSFNQWKHVTESQLRLTFLKGGYNLIDLSNVADYLQAFNPKINFQKAKLDKQLLFFIVRNYTIT